MLSFLVSETRTYGGGHDRHVVEGVAIISQLLSWIEYSTKLSIHFYEYFINFLNDRVSFRKENNLK